MRAITFGLFLAAVALCGGYSARAQSNLQQELDFLNRNCYGIVEPNHQIQSCLAIVDKVKPRLRSGVYGAIAGAYSRLKDFNKAIEYQESSAKSFEANLSDYSKVSSRDKQDIMIARQAAWSMKAQQAAYSAIFQTLGVLETLKSFQLELSQGDTHGAIELSLQAFISFTKAITINPLNHGAYASRARVSARLCKTDDASSDLRLAIELATRAGDKEAVEKYNDIYPDPSNCLREP